MSISELHKDLLDADRRVRRIVSSTTKSFRSPLDIKFDNSPGKQLVPHMILNVTFKREMTSTFQN